MSDTSVSTTARVTETTQQVVDTVLSHVGAGRGGPHAEIETQLQQLVDDEVEQGVRHFALRVRAALNESVYDAMEGHMAAQKVVDDLLGPEPPREPRVVRR